MAAVTVSNTYNSWNGDIKVVTLELGSTPTTGDTYDTNTDATDGRGTIFSKILGAEFYQSAGSAAPDEKPSWNASTGVVTIGLVSTPTLTGTLVISGL